MSASGGSEEKGRPDGPEPGQGTAEDLEALLGEVLEGDASLALSVPATAEPVSPAELDALLGEGAQAGEAPPAEDLGQEEMAGLVEEAYTDHQRMGRLGGCALLVSRDRLKAILRGELPEGTTFKGVEEMLKDAGICHGLIPSRIYDALPQKRSRRREARRRSSATSAAREVVVAEGQAAMPPTPPHIEYGFRIRPAEEVEKVEAILVGQEFGAVRACGIPLPLVRPGQVLARIAQEPGTPGRDVFGAQIPAALPSEVEIETGDNVVLAEDGRSAAAGAWGYAGLRDRVILVLSPLWTSRDLMRVFFVLLPQSGPFPAPSAAQVKELLEREGVVHGIDEPAIAALCERLRQGKGVERATLIARGTEAVPGKDAEWEFVCDPDLTRYFGEILRVIRRGTSAEYLEEYGRGLAGKAVSTGERLAIKHPATEGSMGRDVFGEEFLPEEPRDAELEAGAHVRLAEDGAAYVAELYGYLGIGRRRVQIIPPIWVSPDRMAACFVALSQLGDRHLPAPEELEQLLELAGVRYGVDYQAVGVLCEKMKQGMPTGIAVPIAQGKKPRVGIDGRFLFAVDVERKAGVFREDGSVDFKQLNLLHLVRAGQFLGARIPARKGVPGMDVHGKEIPARDGAALVVEMGKNVGVVQKKGREDQYVAQVEGDLSVVDQRDHSPPRLGLSVQQTLTIKGDVDYSTGNLEYPGNVHIQGAIKPGFQVQAEGDVLVEGQVENGAVVRAGGNVAIQYGIVGQATKIAAGGSVYTRFVNRAEVRLKGDLIVSEYMYHAAVRADGEVAVPGTSKRKNSGTIAGGSVWAGRRISARHLGTTSAGLTRLVAGVDPSLLKQSVELEKLLDRIRSVRGRILRSLEVERLDEAQIRSILLNLVLKARGPRRKIVAGSVKNLLQLQAQLAKAAARKKELDEELERLALEASIAVSGAVAPNTVLRIGSHSLTIQEEGAGVTNVRFGLGKDAEGRLQIQRVAD